MKTKTNIPEHKISLQAQKGILMANLKHYEDYPRHDVTTPHRDDHFTLLIITSGHFEALIDFEAVTINHPAVVVVRPQQVHQGGKIRDMTGWLLNVDPILLPPEISDALSIHPTGVIPFAENPAVANQLVTVPEAIVALLTIPSDAFLQRALQNLLQALFQLVLSLANSQRVSPETSDRGSITYQKFRALLEAHYKDWKKPHQYANSLSLSPVYFNDTIRGQSGHSVSHHIQARNVLEAKRLLVYTEHTASEISHQLGYDDPIYFGKLFKKHAQLSPAQFRTNYRG